MKRATLPSRLIAGFALITVPLVVLLVWNNVYAMKVVQSQVATSNKNLLELYMNQIDTVLVDIEKYIYKTAYDSDLISLGAYGKDDPEAYIAKVRTLNDMFLNLNYYKDADVFFIYNSNLDGLSLASQQHLPFDSKELIKLKLEQLMGDSSKTDIFRSWILINQDGHYSLVRVVNTGYDTYVGAWVDINKLMIPLNLLDLGEDRQALFLSKDGRSLTPMKDPQYAKSIQVADWSVESADSVQPYKTIHLQEKKYLLVVQPSRTSNIQLAVMIPERNLLEGLTLFQKINYFVPVLALLILFFYLLFLQRSIIRPITQLIGGMRRIYSGDLSVRFNDNRLMELKVIGDTFNKMVQQIEVLKIDIYEEQIRTQKAELKHLQVQIHPHFFMNSLNLVYNLAQIRNFELVQKISIHLVKYFRYVIHTHKTSMMISEELDHIHQYLAIQKVRFPDNLTYTIEVDDDLKELRIPPSTIQPLVENAMIHGFSVNLGVPFSIQVIIRADSSPEHLIIEVRDNGRGFPPELLEQFQSRQYFEKE
jgi:two-component system sensor histidine kinase YesM